VGEVILNVEKIEVHMRKVLSIGIRKEQAILYFLMELTFLWDYFVRSGIILRED
jgi:hypothetical protein